MAEIDLVCPWVDGNDPAWQQERQRYASPEMQSGVVMFRDWDLMRYWFRGVEKALPWIRTVHFVTWGHLPPWLNTAHPAPRRVFAQSLSAHLQFQRDHAQCAPHSRAGGAVHPLQR